MSNKKKQQTEKICSDDYWSKERSRVLSKRYIYAHVCWDMARIRHNEHLFIRVSELGGYFFGRDGVRIIDAYFTSRDSFDRFMKEFSQ